MLQHQIMEVLISGAISGSAYAMMAIGMTLVYGVSKIFNFAYGSFYTMGGYFAWLFLATKLGYPATFALVIPVLFFIGLAPNLRTEVFERIKEINGGGITVLMVGQDITEASEYVDRIYLMEDGRIVFEGSKEEVMNDKHVREVFLGI